MKWAIPILIILLLGLTLVTFLSRKTSLLEPIEPSPPSPENQSKTLPTHPLMITEMRKRDYPGSEITIVETLAPGTNYKRYIAAYKSDNLKILGLLTIPNASSPEKKVPGIVFLHGYLEPKTYQTTERYVAYQDGFAKSGFVTFKPDLRGHGKSEGESIASNFSPDYVVDALNALASLQKMPEVNPDRIGFWGHSMGGGITLRAMVVSKDIKAGVIWAGVVGDWEDLLERYRRRIPWLTSDIRPPTRVRFEEFTNKYGSPSANPDFWNAIDPYSYLPDISGPVQLHHGTNDESVPVEFSAHLESALKEASKEVEYWEYPGSDHNIAQGFSQAMNRSIDFFNKHLKD